MIAKSTQIVTKYMSFFYSEIVHFFLDLFKNMTFHLLSEQTNICHILPLCSIGNERQHIYEAHS